MSDALSPLFSAIAIIAFACGAAVLVFLLINLQVVSAWFRNYRAKQMQRQNERKQKAEEKLKELKQELTPPATPHLASTALQQHQTNGASTALLPPPSPSHAAPPIPTVKYPDLEELIVKQGVEIEIGRRATGSNKRVVIAKGKAHLSPKQTQKDIHMFEWHEGLYYIDPKFLVEQYFAQKGTKPAKIRLKLYFDVLYSEPYDLQGELHWDQDLENILADEAMDQYIIACTFEGQFQLTPQLIKLIIVVTVLIIPVGILLNASLHLVPETNIHWVRG